MNSQFKFNAIQVIHASSNVLNTCKYGRKLSLVELKVLFVSVSLYVKLNVLFPMQIESKCHSHLRFIRISPPPAKL